MKLCVVIPAHNEAREIGRLVPAVRAKNVDVLVIDDGSTDQSGSIAAQGGAVVLTNEQKSGKGRSLQRGFRYALERGYEGLITMDGDGQHAPEDLDQFLAQIARESRCIITGNRMDNPTGMPLVRRWTNRFMSWLISSICHQPVPDTQCGYRYICAEFLRTMPLTTGDFEIETEVLIKASRLGYRIFSVPVRSIYSDERSKINPVKDTFRFIVYLARECWAGGFPDKSNRKSAQK